MAESGLETAGCCVSKPKIQSQFSLDVATFIPTIELPQRLQRCQYPVRLEGGHFFMGCDHTQASSEDACSPAFDVTVRPFSIAPFAVTNAEFSAFVTATGYRSDAESCGWSMVFYNQLDPDLPTQAVKDTPWWRVVHGACWHRPAGLGSEHTCLADHPVVHVSWQDAAAFCNWSGARLPSEAEWEYAARGGRGRQNYPWGNEFRPDGTTRCNTWQGSFPHPDSAPGADSGTVPVDAFEANDFGLWNIVGNVWEWCGNSFVPHVGFNDLEDFPPQHSKAIRGGSWLCHANYCARYKVYSRTGSGLDTTAAHIGFRVVLD